MVQEICGLYRLLKMLILEDSFFEKCAQEKRLRMCSTAFAEELRHVTCLSRGQDWMV